MKKILIFLLCVSVCMFSACNKEKTQAPETEVSTSEATEVSTSEAEGELAQVIAALETELNTVPTKNFTEGSFVSTCPFTKEDPAMYNALFSNFKFTLGDAELVDEKTATVEATVTMPDLGAAFMKYLTEASAHASEENWDEDFGVFYDILTNEDATMATSTVTVAMIKGENGWAISLDNDALKDALSGSLSTSGFMNQQ